MKISWSPLVGTFAMLSLLALAPAARAAVLVEYAPGTATSAATLETAASVPAGITASATLATNNGVTFSASGAASPNDVLYAALSTGGTQTTPNEATTITNGTYFTFTLTANSGQTLSLSSLTFNADVSSTSSARAFWVLDSADAYAQSSTLATDNDSGGTLTTSLNAYTANLSGAQYQNLSAITFKFYIAAPSISQNIGFNNIIVNGTVNAVPEPAVSWLLVVGGVAAACGLRRPRTRVRA